MAKCKASTGSAVKGLRVVLCSETAACEAERTNRMHVGWQGRSWNRNKRDPGLSCATDLRQSIGAVHKVIY